MKLLVALAFLALNFYVYHFLARVAEIPAREAFESFPMSLGDWRCDQHHRWIGVGYEEHCCTDYRFECGRDYCV